MLHFDSKGNLKPYQQIHSNIQDLKTYFVDNIASNTRLDIYNKYIRYSNDLKNLIGKELMQWVNGSFVTQKTNPKDIDLITFLDHKDIKKLGSKLDTFKPSECWNIYGVDAYILEVYAPNHDCANFTDCDVAYWLNLFGQTRPNRRTGIKNKKGFLEIIY
jgi:hypothetical protein